MAKRINLLLTAVLAIVCFTALILAAVPFTAQAAEYEYTLNSTRKATATSDVPALLVGKIGSDYYAMEASGTSLKSTNITVADGKVTSNVTDTMLWTVEASSFYRLIKNVGTGKYLQMYTYGASLTASGDTVYKDSNDINSSTYEDYYILLTTQAVQCSKNDSTTFAVYEQKEKQASSTAVTISFAKGNDAASGTMDDVSFEPSTGDYTLPTCGFTLANYTFKGWKVGDAEEVKAAGEKVTVTENTTLTVVWEYSKWIITYKYGDVTSVKEYSKGSTYYMQGISVLSGITMPSGKAFDKWAEEGREQDGPYYLQGERYDFGKDITLVPVWADAITVTYDGNGGTVGSSYAGPQITPANKPYTLYGNATLADHDLVGWYCPLHDTVHKRSSVCEVGSEDITYVAQWQYSGYEITFKVDGQEDVVKKVPITYNNVSGNENTTYKIDVENPTKANANFLGWQFNGDSSKLWKKGDTLTTAQLQALTERTGEFVAQFKEKEIITVTYHFNGETKTEQWEKGVSSLVKFIDELFPDWKGDAATATFKGWSLNEDLSGDLFGKVYKTFNADTDLYAVVQIPYVVTFDFGVEDGIRTKNGDTVNPVEVFYPHPQLELPTKSGYTLVGWATTKGGESVYAAEAGVKVKSACTLYAVWDYNFVVVTLKLGASETVTGETLKGKDKTFSLKGIIDGLSETDRAKVLKEHKNLVWKDKDGREVADDTRLPATADVTYTAVYTDILYTITFDTNGGNEIAPVSAKFGDAITAPTKPMKKGYTFVGWKDERGEDFVFGTMPGRNVTLTAGWTEGDDPNPPVIEPSENVKNAKSAMEALTDGLKLKDKLAKIELADKAIAKLTENEKTELASEISAYNAKVAAVNAEVAKVNADLASAEKAASNLWISVSVALALAAAAVMFVAKRRIF